MESQARQRLSNDHEAVGEVLKQLVTALKNKDAQSSYSKLDLLWARLAVHIRAEHLHLFPVVIKRLTGPTGDAGAPDLSEAQSIVETLHTDHDFFMRELARAIGILRELPKKIVNAGDEAKLNAVLDAVREIEKRLVKHNEIEEKQIYRWTAVILTEPEQMELAAAIDHELQNHPQRFSPDTWDNS